MQRLDRSVTRVERLRCAAMALSVTRGPIDGLWIVEMEVIEDAERPSASFREVFQAEKLEALGLPHVAPVQWNVARVRGGDAAGVPRGAVGQVRARRGGRGLRRDRRHPAGLILRGPGVDGRARRVPRAARVRGPRRTRTRRSRTRPSTRTWSPPIGGPASGTRPSRGTTPNWRSRGRSPTNGSRFPRRTGPTPPSARSGTPAHQRDPHPPSATRGINPLRVAPRVGPVKFLMRTCGRDADPMSSG